MTRTLHSTMFQNKGRYPEHDTQTYELINAQSCVYQEILLSTLYGSEKIWPPLFGQEYKAMRSMRHLFRVVCVYPFSHERGITPFWGSKGFIYFWEINTLFPVLHIFSPRPTQSISRNVRQCVVFCVTPSSATGTKRAGNFWQKTVSLNQQN